MNHLEMEKAKLLAVNIKNFIEYINVNYENKNEFRFHLDKLYQVKLFVKEYKFQILSDELWRINQFEWDEKYTHLLVDLFIKGIETIDEYVSSNYSDLFLLTGRLYTLKNLSTALKKIGVAH